MRVYYFRFYWPSNMLFIVTWVTYVPNVRNIGQKLQSLSWTIAVSDRSTDRQTDRQTHTQLDSSDFISVHALHWTDNNSISHVTTF